MKEDIKALNANPRMTDIQKRRKSIRLYHDLELMKLRHQIDYHIIKYLITFGRAHTGWELPPKIRTH